MKLKKLLISAILVTTCTVTLADPGSFIVGAIIGAVVTQPRHVYVPPGYVIYQAPQQVYNQPPVVISLSHASMYNPELHGYCAGYQNEQYAMCLGNIQRIKNEEAYARGYRGY